MSPHLLEASKQKLMLTPMFLSTASHRTTYIHLVPDMIVHSNFVHHISPRGASPASTGPTQFIKLLDMPASLTHPDSSNTSVSNTFCLANRFGHGQPDHGQRPASRNRGSYAPLSIECETIDRSGMRLRQTHNTINSVSPISTQGLEC